MAIHTLTPDELTQAREWLADCIWADLEAEDIAALDDATVAWGVAKHFEGGIQEFKITCMAYDSCKSVSIAI